MKGFLIEVDDCEIQKVIWSLLRNNISASQRYPIIVIKDNILKWNFLTSLGVVYFNFKLLFHMTYIVMWASQVFVNKTF